MWHHKPVFRTRRQMLIDDWRLTMRCQWQALKELPHRIRPARVAIAWGPGLGRAVRSLVSDLKDK